jgi:hypothetical protein
MQCCVCRDAGNLYIQSARNILQVLLVLVVAVFRQPGLAFVMTQPMMAVTDHVQGQARACFGG